MYFILYNTDRSNDQKVIFPIKIQNIIEGTLTL